MCFNDGYILPAATAIASVLKNSDETDNFHFHIIFAEGRLSPENQEKLRQLESIKPFKIEFCPINFENFKDVYIREGSYFSLETYFRYMIPDIVKDYDKCIYLDSDTIVLRSLDELFNINVSEYYVAGSLDYSVTPQHLQKFGLEVSDGYINAGILVINLKKWREDNVVEELFNNTKKFGSLIEWADQDVINPTFKGKIKFLEAKYNFPVYLYSFKEDVNSYYEPEKFDSSLANIVVAHYLTGHKPWNQFDESFRLYDEWFKYAEMTPFKEELQSVYEKKKEYEKSQSKGFLDKFIKIQSGYRKRRVYLLPELLPGLLRLRFTNYFPSKFFFEVNVGKPVGLS